MALYTDNTISRIIEDVNDKYFLPDIQRPFVWKQEQIYALFDSIMRGYPINTFLFWEVDKNYLNETKTKRFKFLQTNNEDNSEEITFSNNRDYYLVLDGQQRITTLNIVLKGYFVERKKKKELFIDILSGKEENEDGLLYEFNFIDKISELYIKDKERLWVNVKKIYECKNDEERRNLRKEIKKLMPENEDIIEQNIDKLHSRLRTELILNYYTEREKDYDKVLDIFVRTNSGGTKLTYSDLLFSTLKLRWREARENFTNILKEINGEVFEFDTDFILKTCFVIFSETQKDIKYSRKNVDDENKINNIINNWNKITNSIKIGTDLLNRFGITHSKLLSSNNAIIPLIYFIYKNDLKGIGDSNKNKVISPENEKVMKNFLISSLLTGLFGGQSDTILYLIKKEIDYSKEQHFPLGQIKSIMRKRNKETDISEDFLDNLYYKDKNSYLVLNLIYPNITLKTNSKNNLPEQDHIFSRSELKKAGYKEKDIDTIFNIGYISSIDNKIKSNTPFKEWFNESKRKTHLIPEGEWNIEQYNEFLKERRNLFLKKIKEEISQSFSKDKI